MKITAARLAIILGLSLSTTAFAGTCGADYPSLSPSSIYSAPFTLSNQNVAAGSYNYFYYSATAGQSFTVTVTPAFGDDPDVYGSKALYTTAPTNLNKQYSSVGASSATETIFISPTDSECYAFGVTAFIGSASYSVSVTNGGSSSLAVCRSVVANSSETFLEGDFSGDYTIAAGQYRYFYYSAFVFEDVAIKLREAAATLTTADVDLFVANAASNLKPTASSFDFSSVTLGSASEDVSLSTGATEKCYAIGVLAQTGGAYKLQVSSESNIDVDGIVRRGFLFFFLVVGIPIIFCCIVLPVSIAVVCCVCMKPKTVYVMNGQPATSGTTTGGARLL